MSNTAAGSHDPWTERGIPNGRPIRTPYASCMWDDSAYHRLMHPNAQVVDGLFATELDFGAAAFDGQERWIELRVGPDAGSMVTLMPRQKVTPAPYALTAKDLAGPSGMLAGNGPGEVPGGMWHYGFLFAPALTVGGGTSEVLRNVISERLLGLPKEKVWA